MALLDWRLARYLAVGAANTVAGLLVIYIGLFAFGLGNATANALGYAVGICIGFLLNRNWTFRHDGSPMLALLRFLLVLGTAYLVNLAVVLYVAEHLHWNRYLAQALGILPYTVIGYLGSRYFAFAETGRSVGVRGERQDRAATP